MKWIVDRIEDSFAVAECDGVCFDVPLNALPDGIEEGSIITLNVDDATKKERQINADKLLRDIFGE